VFFNKYKRFWVLNHPHLSVPLPSRERKMEDLMIKLSFNEFLSVALLEYLKLIIGDFKNVLSQV